MVQSMGIWSLTNLIFVRCFFDASASAKAARYGVLGAAS